MKWRLVQILAVLRAALPVIRFADARAVLSDDHVVHTALGTIRGVPQQFGNERVSAFLGVPYARPPVGIRRFAKPEKVQPWTVRLSVLCQADEG
ncbi:hypothetical protein ANCCAN_26201 [Ancylostoma caninum]|uniref:Carboxylesterase type B domain-containing protein n=1 Tax=Ancylostoma caninum TaxID=29170 RepID=A0A368F7D1_ANCCA|nr:hypothetical protein ANCCAN_26201 [Ancylostoma caninum]